MFLVGFLFFVFSADPKLRISLFFNFLFFWDSIFHNEYSIYYTFFLFILACFFVLGVLLLVLAAELAVLMFVHGSFC